MAVTFNIAATATGLGVGTLTVTPINVAAGSNIAARVAVEYRDLLTSPDPGAFVSAITLSGFTGTPTFVQMEVNLAVVEVWEVTGGSAGAQSCVVTWDSPAHTPSVQAVVGVQVLNNVKQAAPIGAAGVAFAITNAPSVTLAGTAAGSMCANGVAYDNIVLVTAAVGGGATQDWNLTVGTAGSGRIRGLGSHILSPGGNVTMSWALSAATAWASAAEEWLEQPSTVVKDIIRCPGLVAAPI